MNAHLDRFMLRLTYRAYRIFIRLFKPLLFGVRVLVMKHDEVLLVRHTYRSGWHLPGGGIQRGETLAEAASRELAEETGLQAAALKLMGVYTSLEEGTSGHNILFVCEDFRKVGEHDHEIAEACFFPVERLPADVLPGHRRRVEEYRAGGEYPRFGEW